MHVFLCVMGLLREENDNRSVTPFTSTSTSNSTVERKKRTQGCISKIIRLVLKKKDLVQRF